MLYTEQRVVDRIEVLDSGHVQVRRALRVFREAALISTQYHRVVYAPGDDLTHEEPRVRAIALAAWADYAPPSGRPSRSASPSAVA